METQGYVKAVSDKNGKYGININDTWFNGFGKVPANKGDEVKVEFDVNGNFNNVKRVEILKKAEITQTSSTKFEESNKYKQASVMISYAKDLVVADKIKITELSKYATSLYNLQEELVNPKEQETEVIDKTLVKPEDFK